MLTLRKTTNHTKRRTVCATTRKFKTRNKSKAILKASLDPAKMTKLVVMAGAKQRLQPQTQTKMCKFSKAYAGLSRRRNRRKVAP